MAHREIALPLRVRLITLRKACGDRQPRLVGRQRPWPITLRHQYITNSLLAHREIALPLRVRRIALRQVFVGRQHCLIGVQRCRPIALRHQNVCNLALADDEIALPPRVRRIALRKAFSDRQTRLVGRQRPWPITLRHKYITPAIEPPGFLAWILGSLGLLDQRSENRACLIQFSSADPGIAQLQRCIPIFGIGLQRHLEVGIPEKSDQPGSLI